MEITELNKTKYIVTMPDESKWEIPVLIIAKHRASFYHSKSGDDVQDFVLYLNRTTELFNDDDFEIEDWATNNMNWVDVLSHAVCIDNPNVDFDEGWVNGEHEVN